ncbi:MAG TPA: hypothetical protein P5549_09755 [Syntrophomonas sp.]|nr:hypothetical protein [Syntrophomonas sp.]
MQNRNSGQQGFGLIKLMIKMAMLTVVLMLVAITVPKVIQSLGYSQGQGLVSDVKGMIATINASKVADNVIESSVDDDLPVYKQVINYVPDYATSANLQSIINAIDFYKLANNGQLPQSDEELESYLSKPIASLGPAGATYAITYFPSLILIEATSPSSKIYWAEVEAGAE